MHGDPAFGEQREKSSEFEARLSYLVRLWDAKLNQTKPQRQKKILQFTSNFPLVFVSEKKGSSFEKWKKKRIDEEQEI